MPAHRPPHAPSTPAAPPRFRVLLPGALLLGALAAPPAPASGQGGAADARRTALAEVEGLHADIRLVSMRLWDFSETALREDRSSAFLADLLEEEGFRVERGMAGMPTAFVATWGEGSPVIGVLAEFDALPGVGNAPVPRRAPREDGRTRGHGCGHNLFGAGSVGAGIALKRTMEEEGLEGTVRVYGTPAEETVVGKVYMAREGLFDDLDAALVWHPGTETKVANDAGRALNNFRVTFRGEPAHGAVDPWNGRSALDAVELMNHGVNLMREHVKPSARIHYVIPDGGGAPNVVPDRARAWYYVRDTLRSSVEDHYGWILDIAEGAALATGTEHEVELTTGVHQMLLNRPLQEAVQANLEQVGAPDFPEAYRSFARELQGSLEIDREGLDTEVEPLAEGAEPASGGSTDVAEVSWIAPTVEFNVTSAAAGIPWHSWAATASHGREGAVLSAEVAAKVMALTGVDLLTEPGLLERARAAFREGTGGEAYDSPLPPGQEPPVPEATGRGSR